MNYTYYPSIGLSLLLVAVGAVCYWAVRASAISGVDIRAVGIILMVIGLLGLVLSLLFWASFFPYPRRGSREDDPGHPGPTSI